VDGHAWQDVTYADVIAEALQRHGDRVAFVSGDRRMSYAEAADVTGRMIRALLAHGVTRGGGVIALSPNAPEVYLLQAAAYLIGARFSGLHTLGSPADHVHVAVDSEADALEAAADAGQPVSLALVDLGLADDPAAFVRALRRASPRSRANPRPSAISRTSARGRRRSATRSC